jgi:predicted secreted hydrolase
MLRSIFGVAIGLSLSVLAFAAPPAASDDTTHYAAVLPGQPLTFPADHGAHPDYRTEWWYLTGWLDTPDGPQGFQITFFRSRPRIDEANPSAFAARQILFAHAALSDPKVGKLLADQRIGRQGFDLADAATTDTAIVLDDWRLDRHADGNFVAQVATPDFKLDLRFAPTQAILLQGEAGYSRKGPLPSEASHYYSVPHLAVSGTLARGERTIDVKGEAWLDREWFSDLIDPKAVGWDWTGLNLDDGSAVMAFQVRDAAGKAVWAGGSVRSAHGEVINLAPADVRFESLRRWHSPRSGADYPVEREVTLRLPTGARSFTLKPLLDDQELDSRSTGGPIYWEGAVRTEGGRGYLELVGYAPTTALDASLK